MQNGIFLTTGSNNNNLTGNNASYNTSGLNVQSNLNDYNDQYCE